MYPIEVNSVSDLISNIDLVPNDDLANIYRGEPENYPQPYTPSLFRGKYRANQLDFWGGFRHERSRIEKWCEEVEATEGSYLTYRNDLDKMILARHYGLLTRLLDWSSNPLVAVWFAVCDNDDVDGYIYSHPQPPVMSSKSVITEPQDGVSDRRSALEINSFCLNMQAHLTNGKGELKPFKAVHFYRPHSLPNPRILSQSGAISIHPNPGKHSKKFEPLLRFLIPAASKRILRRELKVVGINDRSLGLTTRDGIASKLNHTL